jgi:hypothetical protein
MSNTLRKKVEGLIEAENKKNKGLAEPILSEKFIAITRASGKEQNREGLLEAIEMGNSKTPDIVRILEDDGYDLVRESDNLGVIRSIVATTNPSGRYRNNHVFVKEVTEWRCISWQVTKLE